MKRVWDDIGFAILILALAVTATILIVPLIYAIAMSFEPRGFMGPFPPPGISLQWYERFFESPYYMRALGISLLVATVSASISALFGALAAVGISRGGFPGAQFLSVLFLSPLVVPGVVIGFSLLLFFSRTAVAGDLVKILIAHVLLTLPYTIRASLAAMAGINANIIDAALSLGATEGQALRKVILPLARTGIVTGFIFAFCFSLDDVAVTIFLTSPTVYTLPVALVSNMKSNFDLTIAAASIMLMLFALVVILVLDRVVGIEAVMGKGMYRD
ncbi:putative spermidine/putrescine transport system permease protein [Rhodoligotrophos appendicifer]|uniref:ABC transporter permease n=1 Tax=Rhodoligotrophos appendicifer TaxID=987056 RepID=UPI0011859A45|nr:ABC transporter permease [Rhodoligotrophos appendicifer]